MSPRLLSSSTNSSSLQLSIYFFLFFTEFNTPSCKQLTWEGYHHGNRKWEELQSTDINRGHCCPGQLVCCHGILTTLPVYQIESCDWNLKRLTCSGSVLDTCTHTTIHINVVYISHGFTYTIVTTSSISCHKSNVNCTSAIYSTHEFCVSCMSRQFCLLNL